MAGPGSFASSTFALIKGVLPDPSYNKFMLGWLVQKLRVLRRDLALPRLPQQTIRAHRFWLYLNHHTRQRPVLTRPIPLVARTTLELFLQCQDTRALHLLEVGFLRLRDRKALVLAHPGLLHPGQTLTLQNNGLELVSRLGHSEVMAPYVRTAEGLLYYEQPFVFEPGLLSVAVPVKPRPRNLKGQAQPLPEPTVRRCSRS